MASCAGWFTVGGHFFLLQTYRTWGADILLSQQLSVYFSCTLTTVRGSNEFSMMHIHAMNVSLFTCETNILHIWNENQTGTISRYVPYFMSKHLVWATLTISAINEKETSAIYHGGLGKALICHGSWKQRDDQWFYLHLNLALAVTWTKAFKRI